MSGHFPDWAWVAGKVFSAQPLREPRHLKLAGICACVCLPLANPKSSGRVAEA